MAMATYDFWSICRAYVRVVRFVQWKWMQVQESRWLPVILDLALGFIICALFDPDDRLAQNIATDFDTFIAWLQSIIEWLMGNPAGLKLNKPLNTTMGNFFLYHIYLWKTYITFLKPFLLYSLLALKWIGCLGGISLQIGLASDLVSILTVHIYCFYVYAGRLYQLQKTGLISLWRLFRGKKYNPLRKRVDSAEFDSQQLFLGVLIFTVLVFLLPTVLVYYGVFAGLRLIVYVGQTLCEYLVGLIFDQRGLRGRKDQNEPLKEPNFSKLLSNIFNALISGELLL